MLKIYSKNNCVNCIKVKSICYQKNIDFQELILDTDYKKEDVIQMKPNVRTLPFILDEKTGDMFEYHEFVRIFS